MLYDCPKCGRYGMEWDGRAKVLICHFNSCRHVVRIRNQKAIPTHEQIISAIENDFLRRKPPFKSVAIAVAMLYFYNLAGRAAGHRE